MRGIDVSNHNGTINWSKVKQSDIEAVYIKATEGTTYRDGWLDNHYNGAKSVNLYTGFYHFLVGTSQPETQAENFWNSIKSKKSDLLPCLDIEMPGFSVDNYAIRFINKFKELSGLSMVIYTGAYFSRDNLPLEIKQNYPLWLAHYGVEPWKSNLVTLAGFTILAGHQYTEKGHINGINTNVDMNVFNESIFLDKSNISINNTDSSDWLAEYLKSWNWSEWVGKLQRTIGVNVDKIVGPITLKACTLLKKGMYGELVRRLQEVLKAYGFNCGDIDGIFGDNTYNAVVAFQKSRGLAIDGVVGYNTWKALLGL